MIPLLDAAAFAELADVYFPTPARIEAQTGTTQEPSGQEIPEWTTLPAGATLRVGMAPLPASREMRTMDMTVVTTRRQARLAGAYPSITPGMRLVTINPDASEEIWNILTVDTDSTQTITQLIVERVDPGAS